MTTKNDLWQNAYSRETADVIRAGLSPAHFAMHCDPKWRPSQFHRVVNSALLAVEDGRIDRLIIEAPPRHGKSELGNRFFTSHYLGRFPDRNVMTTSATDELAATFSTKSRNILSEFGPSVFGVGIGERTASHFWTTTEGGSCRAAGVGGAIMGQGADLCLVDDYFKNVEEALSETKRQKADEWFLTTLRTRLTPKGAIVIIATRWHLDDLIGRRIRESKEGGETWHVIRCRAIAEHGEEDPLGRKPGDALWPEQWTADKLGAIRQSFHVTGYPWMWEALYQQHPPTMLDCEWPAEFFADHIWTDHDPPESEIVCNVVAVDPSLGKTDKSDYSAIVGVKKDIHDVYWVNADLARRPSSRIVEDGLAMYRQQRAIALGCETNQFQELLGEQFRDRAIHYGMDVYFCSIHNAIAKVTRIRSLTPIFAQRRIRFKRSPGTSLLIEQLKGFPEHRHDDGPDALEMGIRLTETVMRGAVLDTE